MLREFCARPADGPTVFQRTDDPAFSFRSGEPGCGPWFSLEFSGPSVMFARGVDVAMTDLEQALVQELFDRLVDGVAFGSLIATPDGPQWGWSAPAMPYPYFYGIASHAIAYAGYLGDRVWPVVQQVATGELSVTDAVAILERGSEQGRAEFSSLEP